MIATLGAARCGGTGERLDEDAHLLAKDGQELLAVESGVESLGSAIADADGAKTADEAGAALAREAQSADRLGAGCAVVVRSPQNGLLSGRNEYRLTACPGRSGPVTGTVVVRYQVESGWLHLDSSATDLRVGGARLERWTASADVSATAGERTLLWQSDVEGALPSPSGPRRFARRTEKTLRWRVGAECVRVDGASQGTFVARGVERTLRVELAGLELCRALPCPSPGGVVRVEDVPSGKDVLLRFVGTGRAMLRLPDDRTVPVVPACAR
jgi:hypothetical protein